MTSSGLSHVVTDFAALTILGVKKSIMYLTPDIYSPSEGIFEYSYGQFDVSNEEPVKSFLTASIRDVHGDALFTRQVTHDDLAFKQQNTRFSKMCMTKMSL
jgi:hypothetical protein